MAITLSRTLYTHYKRSKNDFPFATASTAMPPNYGEPVFETQNNIDDEKKQLTVSQTEPLYSADQLAILPQHITSASTTLVIKESFPPLRHGCFAVASSAGIAIFKIDREIPSLSRRRDIIDAKTGLKLLTVRRDVGSLPRSYYLEDPDSHKVLELQGKFYVPFQGPRSTAAFVNALSGEKIYLFMQGSWLNRNVEIVEKKTGRVVARAEREILSVRNAVGGRTTYTVFVEAGVDVTLVVGLIMALDDRAD